MQEIVNDIVMATTNHQLPEKLQGCHRDIASVFLDADLSVLGQTEKYDEYAWAIWKEYEFIGRDKYLEGRPAVLERMLTQREHLYFNKDIRLKLETPARTNVQGEIKKLLAEKAAGVAKVI